MKWRELEQEQAKPLDYKILKAQEAIWEAFRIAKRPALAFSGGKDSTVLLHLLRTSHQLARGMPVIYGNTGVEFPECARFVRRMECELDLNLYEARPNKTSEPAYKYQAQRMIFDRLIETGQQTSALRSDGKLKSLAALERRCPPDLRAHIEQNGLIWPEGTRMSYRWCTDQYGWPLLGKAWSQLDAHRINIDAFLKFSHSKSANKKLLKYYKILRSVKISQHCCHVLKKEPSERLQAQIGIDLVFKGLMASESRARSKNFLTRGYLFEGAARDYLHGDPFFHCQPLAIWTDADIWQYIKRFGVSYAPLYDMTYIALDGSTQHVKRNGCMGCATDFGYQNNHLYVLRQTHKAAWRGIMRAGMAQQIRNLQRAMKAGQLTLFDVFNTDELIDAQPCVFDDLDGLGGRQAPDRLTYDPEVY